MIEFKTSSGSHYQVDPIGNLYRKVGEPWKECVRGFNFDPDHYTDLYGPPLVGRRYGITLPSGKDLVTSTVREVL